MESPELSSPEEFIALVEETLVRCDTDTTTKIFEIEWAGDINDLLIPSMTNRALRYVRVAGPNRYQIFNYRYAGADIEAIQQEERRSGYRLQRSIGEQSGHYLENEPGDFYLTFDPEIVEKYLKSTGQETRHAPATISLETIFYEVTEEIRRTRASLEHLLPIQEREPITVTIKDRNAPDDDSVEAGAKYLSTPEDRNMALPKNGHSGESQLIYRQDVFNHKPYEIDPTSSRLNIIESSGPEVSSLASELRHHLHYTIAKPTSRDSTWIGITELVDELKLLHRPRDNHEELASDNLEANISMLMRLTANFNHLPKGWNGHDLAQPVSSELCRLVNGQALSAEERKRIDKAIFDFLTDLDVNCENAETERFIRWAKDHSPEELYGKDIMERVQQDPDSLELDDVKTLVERTTPREIVEKYDGDLWRIFVARKKYKKLHENLKKCHTLASKVRDEYKTTCKKIPFIFMNSTIINMIYKNAKTSEAEINALIEETSALLIELNPYQGPNGQEYPNVLSYAFDIDNLKDIVKEKTGIELA
ncbi:MAG: hypothetical protein AAB373_02020 [Patescibacteria group bacterium]